MGTISEFDVVKILHQKKVKLFDVVLRRQDFSDREARGFSGSLSKIVKRRRY